MGSKKVFLTELGLSKKRVKKNKKIIADLFQKFCRQSAEKFF